MLIDDITIKVRAGHGGAGKVAFNKNAMMLGPAGGSGGRGAGVIFRGTSDLSALNYFRYKKEVIAPDGEAGQSQFNDGHDAKDIVIKIPVGTVIHNLTTNEDIEITSPKEELIIAKGGLGGRGNFHFRSSKNTSPKRAQSGLPGEEFTLRLELKFIADIGLIGLPNVGKSSLINELTNANSKVANYHFTTLEPHLGVYNHKILADIPGLIKGASRGRGLGHKFLRHIERTKILFHLIDATSKKPITDYKTIRQELKNHNPNLIKKPEIILLSKSDLVDKKNTIRLIKKLKTYNKKTYPISIHDFDSIKFIKDFISKIK